MSSFDDAVNYASKRIMEGVEGYDAIGEASNKFDVDFRDIAKALSNRGRGVRLAKKDRERVDLNVDKFLKTKVRRNRHGEQGIF